jgi:hypothetical protein
LLAIISHDQIAKLQKPNDLNRQTEAIEAHKKTHAAYILLNLDVSLSYGLSPSKGVETEKPSPSTFIPSAVQQAQKVSKLQQMHPESSCPTQLFLPLKTVN